MLQKWKSTVRKLKEDIYTLYLAYRDPRVPFHAKIVLIITVAYAFSPIDLIPDFIPVLGYLDDLLLVPLGVWLVVRLAPAAVLEASRASAQEASERPTSLTAAIVIICLWTAAILWVAVLGYRWVMRA